MKISGGDDDNYLMECGHKQTVYTIEYVSLIVINKQINVNYTGEPFLWLSERINEKGTMHGMYNCPGGHIYTDETEEEALIRETFEETALNLNNENTTRKICTHVIYNNENRDNGLKVVHIYELVTSSELKNTETEKLGPWKQYTFREVLELPVIDSVKEYVRRKVSQLLRYKRFIIVEGTVGAGKSTLIEEFISPMWSEKLREEVKVIHEAAVREEVKPKLKEFYERNITLLQFQKIIESKYYDIMCEEILFDGKERGNYILDRSQVSTIIFSKMGDLQREELRKLKRNRVYWDQIVKKSCIIYIRSSRNRVLKNKKIRARTEENAMDIEYLEDLHDAYYYLMKKAYKTVIREDMMRTGTYIVNDIQIINNSKNINRNRNTLKKEIKDVLKLIGHTLRY